MRRPLFVALVGTVALASAATALAAPTTLVRSELPIFAVAQDGTRIAWIQASPNRMPESAYESEYCGTIYVRQISGGRRVPLRRSCRHWLSSLVFVGRRALWTEGAGDRSDAYWQYRTAALDDRFVVRLDDFWASNDVPAGSSSWESGDGGTIAYGWSYRGLVDPDCDDYEENCDYEVKAGGVVRVRGGRTVRVPGIPAVSNIAANRGRVAVLLAVPDRVDPLRAVIEVRQATSGALVSRFFIDGWACELALSGTSVIVEVCDGETAHLERHDAATGILEGSIAAPPNLWSLDVEDETVVFATRRTAGVWRSGATTTETLWQGAMGEGELSIDGDRLVWIAGAYGRPQRILALTLPPAP